MRRQLEELKHLWPLACVVTGICLVESNLALIPWKVLGFLLASLSVAYVGVRIMGFPRKEESKMLKGLESIIMMKIACSDNSIPEIKKRMKELKEAVEADPEFWEYYFPGLIKKEEK